MALIRAFARAVDELHYDAAFADVEFVSHSAQRRARSHFLVVVVDRAQGADVALCERIAAALNAKLQECDEPYTLEVESAGLDRPLRKAGDYQRFAGRLAKISTTMAIRGAKTHRGTLRGVQGTNVILQTTGGELPVPLVAIRSANLEYDVRADLRRAKQERKYHEHHA